MLQGDKWYLVCNKWWQMWREYVQYDETDAVPPPMAGDEPPGEMTRSTSLKYQPPTPLSYRCKAEAARSIGLESGPHWWTTLCSPWMVPSVECRWQAVPSAPGCRPFYLALLPPVVVALVPSLHRPTVAPRSVHTC